MQGYLLTVLAVSAVVAILGVLPGDERLKRPVSLILSLAVMASVVIPLPALLSGLPQDYSAYLDRLEGESEVGSDYLEGETLAAVGEGIAAYLSDRYDLPAGGLTVTVEGDIVDSTVILRRVRLCLSPVAASADARSMIRDVKRETGAECEVIYLEE